MRRVMFVAFLASIASCYQAPSVASCKYRCGGANNDSCPSGYSCAEGMCVAPGEGCDGDGGVIDAPPDDAPIPVCSDPSAFTWAAAQDVIAGDVVRGVVVADVNNDSMADLATIEGNATVAVYLGNGDGTFSSRIDTGITNARRIIPGDWDHDMIPDDLLVLGAGTAIHLLSSNGDGSFTTRMYTHSGATAVLDIASLGDADGDNVPDIAILFTTAGAGTRVQALAQGPGNAAGSMSFTTLGTSQATSNIAVSLGASGDIDDDDHLDAFVIATTAGGTLHQLVRHAGQTSGLAGPMATNVNEGPTDAVIGLLHASGYKSAVSANKTANTISIRRWSQTGWTNAGDHAVGIGPVAVILANIGGDELPEIVTADLGGNALSVLLNTNGTFTRSMVLVPSPFDVDHADFDMDGRQDLVVATQGASAVHILLNKCPL